MKLLKSIRLCSVVDCAGVSCRDCPAQGHPRLSSIERAIKWWERHWNFNDNPYPEEKMNPELRLKKKALCSFVYCSPIECKECPANGNEKSFLPADGEKWWRDNWDFNKNCPKSSFKKGDLVLIRDNKNEKWKIKFFVDYDPDTNFAFPFLVSDTLESSKDDVSRWIYCKPYKPGE